MYDINRGKLCTLKTLLEGDSQIDPAAAAAVVAALALLLVLHPAVLEPDLHLLLRQIQVGRDLDAAQAGQVHVGGELALQL